MQLQPYAGLVTAIIQQNLRHSAGSLIMVETMITTKKPESEPVDPDPESTTDSVIVVRLPEGQLGHSELIELVAGAATAARLLDLPELQLCATAEQLPKLAMAAAEVSDIPEGLQLCQSDAAADQMENEVEQPENPTVLSVESLIRLTRARETV